MKEFNLKKFVRPNLLNIKPYRALRDSENFDQPVYLEANENPFGQYNRYPDSGQTELKKKLAELKGVSPENLTIGNGSDELIDLLMRTFCRPEIDKILLPVPSFSMYSFYAALNDVDTVDLNLTSSFQINKGYFLAKTRTQKFSMLFLCSPNNPTGNSLDDIEFFISNFKGIVVVDEAYIEFSEKDSVAKLVEEYPNLVVLQTLSKAYGMAGLRIGMAITSPEIAALLNILKPPYNVSSQSQETAIEILSDKEILYDNIQKILREKEKMQKAFQDFRFVKKVYRSDANFFLVEFTNASLVHEFLVSEQILTSKRTSDVPNCLRINVGTAAENQRLFKALEDYQRKIID